MMILVLARTWEKKKIEPIFTEKCFNASVVYNMEVLEHFGTKNYAWRINIDFLGQNISKYILENIQNSLAQKIIHKNLI